MDLLCQAPRCAVHNPKYHDRRCDRRDRVLASQRAGLGLFCAFVSVPLSARRSPASPSGSPATRGLLLLGPGDSDESIVRCLLHYTGCVYPHAPLHRTNDDRPELERAHWIRPGSSRRATEPKQPHRRLEPGRLLGRRMVVPRRRLRFHHLPQTVILSRNISYVNPRPVGSQQWSGQECERMPSERCKWPRSSALLEID